MPDSPFITHEYDAIPLNRSTVPLPECKVGPALQDGKVIKVVDVPILGCPGVWLRCQKEAEQWVSGCDGNVLADPMLVNRRINAAYAYLWLTDRRFQWAGLAAFASKQVGCGLLHAAQTAEQAKARIRAQPGEDSGDFLGKNAFDLGVGGGSEYMYKQLALGNLTLFLDIYPMHRFYMLRGIEGVRECLGKRKLISQKVYWPKDVEPKLPFGELFREVPRWPGKFPHFWPGQIPPPLST